MKYLKKLYAFYVTICWFTEYIAYFRHKPLAMYRNTCTRLIVFTHDLGINVSN